MLHTQKHVNVSHQVSCVSSFQLASSSYDAEWRYSCKHEWHNPQQIPTKTVVHRIQVELPDVRGQYICPTQSLMGQDKANKGGGLLMKRYQQIPELELLASRDGRLAVQSVEKSPVPRFIAKVLS